MHYVGVAGVGRHGHIVGADKWADAEALGGNGCDNHRHLFMLCVQLLICLLY
jgi:hypothetical protein